MVTTLCELLLNSVRAYPKAEFHARQEGRPLHARSRWPNSAPKIRHFSLGLQRPGPRQGRQAHHPFRKQAGMDDDRFRLISAWAAITVPIYTTLVPEQVKYIINDSDAKIVVFSDAEQWAKIEAVKADLPQVKHFITFAAQAPGGLPDFGRGHRPGRRDRRRPARPVRGDRPRRQARTTRPRSSTPRARPACPRASS